MGWVCLTQENTYLMFPGHPGSIIMMGQHSLIILHRSATLKDLLEVLVSINSRHIFFPTWHTGVLGKVLVIEGTSLRLVGRFYREVIEM